jgi:amino acid transporter
MYLVQVFWGSQKTVTADGPEFISDNYDYVVRFIAGAMILIMHYFLMFMPKTGLLIMDGLTSLKVATLCLVVVVGIIAAFGVFPNAPPSGNYSNLFLDSNYDPNILVNNFFQVLYIYDGWNTVNYSLSEMIDPMRNLPKASFYSIYLTLFLYVGATLAFFVVVPVKDLTADGDIIAIQFFNATLGELFGSKIIPVLICLAGFSSSMTIAYANSRIIFETAKDAMLPPQAYLAKVSAKDSPIYSILLNMIICLTFIFAPPPGKSYEFLINLASYPEWLFLGLTVVALIRLRYTHPHVVRPVVSSMVGNIVFIIVCIGLAVMPFVPPSKSDPDDLPYYLVPTLAWVVIILIGVIWYLYSEVCHQMVESSDEDIFEKSRKEIEEDEELNTHHIL